MNEPDISALHRALEARAQEKTRAHWTRYLKGSATFVGVPMAGVREEAHAWWQAQGLSARSLKVRLQAALSLFDGDPTEHRLAGVLLLAEALMPELGAEHLEVLAGLYERDRITDWNLCDWFCVKVLAGLVARDPGDIAPRLAAWHTSEHLWRRRSACVGFVSLAPRAEEVWAPLPALVLETCAAVAHDPRRFVQTGLAWTLRELSVERPREVETFARAHMQTLSREAMRSMTQKLEEDVRLALLQEHKQAT